MVDLLRSNEAKRSEVWEGKTGVSLKVGSQPSVFVCVCVRECLCVSSESET